MKATKVRQRRPGSPPVIHFAREIPHEHESRSSILSTGRLIEGLVKQAATIPTVIVDGAVVKNADVVARLELLVASIERVIAARGALRAAVASNDALQAENARFVADLRSMLRASFGREPAILLGFGLEVNRPPPGPASKSSWPPPRPRPRAPRAGPRAAGNGWRSPARSPAWSSRRWGRGEDGAE